MVCVSPGNTQDTAYVISSKVAVENTDIAFSSLRVSVTSSVTSSVASSPVVSLVSSIDTCVASLDSIASTGLVIPKKPNIKIKQALNILLFNFLTLL